MFHMIHTRNRDYRITLNYVSNLGRNSVLKIEENLPIKKLQGTVMFPQEACSL